MAQGTWEQAALEWPVGPTCPYCGREIVKASKVKPENRANCGDLECQKAHKVARTATYNAAQRAARPVRAHRCTKVCPDCGREFGSDTGRKIRCDDCGSCRQCGRWLDSKMLERSTEFCSKRCEHEWARDHDPDFALPACAICGRAVLATSGGGLDRRKTCGGEECRRRYNLERNWTGTDPLGGRFKPGQNKTFTLTCILCDEQFQAKSGSRQRCPDCCKCQWCGAQLNKRETKTRFCNQFCAGKWRVVHTASGSGYRHRGEDHWNWKGGISPLRAAAMSRMEYKVWRFTVYKRDGFACILCGDKADIHAHHIKPWRSHEELRYDVSNGVTLCEPHHMAMGRREADFEARFLAYVTTCQPTLPLAEELAQFEPFITDCDHCGKETELPRRYRTRKFHFCEADCFRAFRKALPPGGWSAAYELKQSRLAAAS